MKGVFSHANVGGMNTLVEIESAIENLHPHERRELREWLAKRPEEPDGRMWSPDELVEAARVMIEEKDPKRADEQWERIVAGFYGDPDPRA